MRNFIHCAMSIRDEELVKAYTENDVIFLLR
jgi:hypothetical protein